MTATLSNSFSGTEIENLTGILANVTSFGMFYYNPRPIVCLLDKSLHVAVNDLLLSVPAGGPVIRPQPQPGMRQITGCYSRARHWFLGEGSV